MVAILGLASSFLDMHHAQAEVPSSGADWTKCSSEATPSYYHGGIASVCENADPKTETLVNASDYCDAYPKHCIGKQAVCFGGLPVIALHSKAYQNVYQKKLSSYIQNQKTVCKDFPWTCPISPKITAAIQNGDEEALAKLPEIKSQLPKKAVICHKDVDCEGKTGCYYNNYGMTGTLKICKDPYNVTCSNDASCPNKLFCSKGKCVECVRNGNNIPKDMECVNGRLNEIVRDLPKRPELPDILPCSGPCPNGYKRFNVKFATSSGFGEECSCRKLSSSGYRRSYSGSHVPPSFGVDCKSDMDCNIKELCNHFYGKCIKT